MRIKTPQQAEKMLDVAARLFGSHRFHEVRMEDIAAEAGVGKGTLYRYFEDKEELYLALLARSSTQYLERLHAEVEGQAGARAKLEAAVRTILDFFFHNPHILDLIQRAEVQVGLGPDFPWHSTRAATCKLVQDLFELGLREGAFRVQEPEVAALMLLGGLRSLIRFGPHLNAADLPRRVVDGFLNGASWCGPKPLTTHTVVSGSDSLRLAHTCTPGQAVPSLDASPSTPNRSDA